MESNHSRATRSLLIEWARWRDYQSGEVKGFPGEVPFYRMMRGSSVSGPLITDDTAERVDSAVSRLTNRCPDQGAVLTLYYRDYKSIPDICKSQKIGETRARELLRTAENAIEWILDCTS